MTAKTLRNKGATDCTGGPTREQSAIHRKTKVTSGSNGRKPKGFGRFNEGIKRMLKLEAAEKALSDAVEKECLAEEKYYCGLHDRPKSYTTFDEKQFGNLDDPVARDFPCSVVSLALFDGDTMLFACSGIPLPPGRAKLPLTRYVTSERLVRVYQGYMYRDDKLRIVVRLPNDEKVGGLLELYNSHIAIVTCLSLQAVKPLDLIQASTPTSSSDEMIAAGRAFQSGCLMSAKVKPVPVSQKDLSGWKIVNVYKCGPEAVLGGPVIGNDNRIIGINFDVHGAFSPDAENLCVLFVPLDSLYTYLHHFRILSREGLWFREYSLPEGVYTLVPSAFRRRIYRIMHFSYPMPPPLVLELNGVLRNQFEECFGEVCAWKGYPFGVPPYSSVERVWVRLGNDVLKDVSRRVVSVASFKGYNRLFACTGLLIKWRESTAVLTSASVIGCCHDHDESYGLCKDFMCNSCYYDEDGIRHGQMSEIKVFLPPNQRANGTLKLYSSNYNIAIISLDKKLIGTRPEDIFKENSTRKSSGKVVAIGRETIRGLLMASMGEVKPRDKDCELDCKDLKLSTCKIKKAGIGGPLINFDGSFVGMNHFDGRMVTPFLPKSKIVQVLRQGVSVRRDDGPVHLRDASEGSRINRWPVPRPYWYHGLLDADRDDHLPAVSRGRVLQ
ncbi:uncharacterized protein LOC119326483 isoform X1 [Triticum dicoccoides]|uniref:uncharacterized protein LOC119326483 isoform X1 n=1 Tax=Triticum dicoccoides TaxID=85692 RepID=UPI000E795D24|nr:uncharacterized protein LOC119326483 isoform X1 [Triticum dicoccoides]